MTCNEKCIYFPVCKIKKYDFANIDECMYYAESLDQDAREASIPYTYNAPEHDWKCGYPDVTSTDNNSCWLDGYNTAKKLFKRPKGEWKFIQGATTVAICCSTCKHCDKMITEEPCMICRWCDQWEDKEVDSEDNKM